MHSSIAQYNKIYIIQYILQVATYILYVATCKENYLAYVVINRLSYIVRCVRQMRSDGLLRDTYPTIFGEFLFSSNLWLWFRAY